VLQDGNQGPTNAQYQSALVVVEMGGHVPVLEYAGVPLVGEDPDAERTKTSALPTMADVSIIVLIRQEATDVIATRVTDFLEGTVEILMSAADQTTVSRDASINPVATPVPVTAAIDSVRTP